tara:strand:- start:341 stop:601 length:261 start_codon:yes stop_codon:yes gene_type:complete
MSKSNPPALLSGLHITNANNGPAIDWNGSTMSLNTQATITLGSITLTEDKFAKMEAMLEFIERFTQEDERAKAIWVAIKAKKRILG